MAVKVHIPAPMRQHTENLATVAAAGSTVQAVLDDVCAKYPGITDRLMDKGQVRRFVNIYINDEDVRYLDAMQTLVHDGDELSIIPAVAGG